MENFEKKVIRASAGTGKTYRLSLEYIGLLLKFRKHGIQFSEILVITFTKKATAEIRERIFAHLQAIIDRSDSGLELCKNLREIFEVTVSDADIDYLQHVYHEMLMNKHLVQISTIDSFTNTIFQTIIAPYLGLTQYKVENRIQPDMLAEIYEVILSNNDNFQKLKDFFTRSGRKTIQDYENLITSIIQERWIFHLMAQHKPKNESSPDIREMIDSFLVRYRVFFEEILRQFDEYVSKNHGDRNIDEILKKNFRELFSDRHTELSVDNFVDVICDKLKDNNFILINQKMLLVDDFFWNGSRMFRKKNEKSEAEELLEKLDQAKENLAEYLFYTELLKEEREIIEIATVILEKYDSIKIRDKVFTFNDITYYTYKYLYDPELSLTENDSVTNAFYEYLSSALRFILIDEFQDTSIVQLKILLPIIREVISGIGAKNYGGAIVVGDEKQAIYGWRGGERDLLLNMPAILHQAEEATLDTSYRSDQRLISFVNHVFTNPVYRKLLTENSIEWPYKDISTVREENDGYIQVNFRNYANGKKDTNTISREEDAMREFIEDVVYPHIRDHNVKLASIAILSRKNKDLSNMARILDELGINNILESSNTIAKHRAIKPIFYFYRYLVFKDFNDVLKFFRSDLVLMNAVDLKEILVAYKEVTHNGGAHADIFQKVSHLEDVKYFWDFYQTYCHQQDGYPGGQILKLTKAFLEQYNVPGKFNLETDLKNINFLLEIIVDFENNVRDYSKSLHGFLEFCRDNEETDELQQLGLENSDAIHLMSIHKAKGLEFDDVFLYWNLSGRSGNRTGNMNTYLRYSPDFNQLDEFVLTYNYDHVLSKCHLKSIQQNAQQREIVEELNNFYVAATRAKTNLFLYMSYSKAGGMEKFLDDLEKKEQPNAQHVIALSLYDSLMNNYLLKQENPYKAQATIGQINPVSTSPDKPVARQNRGFLKQYYHFEPSIYLERDDKRLQAEENLNFKSTYIKKRDADMGTIAHYYLSFIKYGTGQEKKIARDRTIAHYGNLMVERDIRALLDKVDLFIMNHKDDIFSAQMWPKVFNEFTLFGESGREVRLDRLMINETSKKIMIIDYKTGDTYEELQIEDYRKTVEALDFVKKGGYSIDDKFVEIDIGVVNLGEQAF